MGCADVNKRNIKTPRTECEAFRDLTGVALRGRRQ